MTTVSDGVSVLVRSSVTELRRRSDSVSSQQAASKPAARQNQVAPMSDVPEVLDKSDGSLNKSSIEFEESLMAEGKGEWHHAWYHLVCIIAGAGTMTFPATYAYLGWTAGIICWIIGISFAYYTAYIITIAVDDLSKQHGKRFVRFRDVTCKVWGPRAGIVAIVPWQYLNVVGISIALMIGAGQGLQGIQTTLQPTVEYLTAAKSPVPLYGYIMVSCVVWWLTALLPSFHKLRFLSFLALLCFIVFSSITLSLCFNHGSITDAANQQAALDARAFNNDYGEVVGYPSSTDTVVGVMNALATIAFAYGNCILPEVMGTVKDTPEKPMRKAMFKAYNWEFALVAPYYLLVGIAGYWAFGFSTVTYNFIIAQLLPPGVIPDFPGDGPAWTLVLANLAIFIQAIPSCQVYNQVLYDVFDPMLCKADKGIWHPWNVAMRMVVRTTYIVAIGFISCLLPFFGSFVSLIGALSVIPSVFVVPCLLHLVVSKPGYKSWLFYADWIIAAISLVVGVMGTYSSIYPINQAAITFKVFSPTG